MKKLKSTIRESESSPLYELEIEGFMRVLVGGISTARGRLWWMVALIAEVGGADSVAGRNRGWLAQGPRGAAVVAAAVGYVGEMVSFAMLFFCVDFQ